MKSHAKMTGVPGRQVPGGGQDRKRLIVLVVTTLLVGVAWLAATFQKGKYEHEESAHLPAAAAQEPEVVLALPDIDPAELDALVADGAPEDRVMLERPGVEAALAIASRLVARQYDELGARELDAAGAAELMANPGATRGKAVRLRGWIESLETRPATGMRPEEHLGRLLLEDRTPVYFLCLRLPAGATGVGDFVRLDGLFLKVYSDETDSGWVEAPLIVGSRMRRSWSRQETPDAGIVAARLAPVQDDGLESFEGEFEDAKWMLMEYARDLPEGPESEVDWENAPLLTRPLHQEIIRDGASWRGKPVRLPISVVMGITVLDAGENPARMDRITDGWIGNTTWAVQGLIHFVAPFALTDIREKQLVTARGFFFRNHNYELRDGGVGRTSLFVLHSVSPHVAAADRSGDVILAVVLAGFAGTFLLVVVLVTRDRKRSKQLHEDMVRRRQARRAQAGAQPGPQPG